MTDAERFFDARALREKAERLAPELPPWADVLALLDACDEAYERLSAGDLLGAKLTLGWPRD